MLAIHGIWSDGLLHLWAEESEKPQAAASRLAGQMRAHPFAAAADLVSDVLAEFGDPASDLVRKATEAELTLWLPATSAGPLASPECPPADGTAADAPGPDATGASLP